MSTPKDSKPVTRRDFLRSSSAAVAAGGLLGTLSIERAAFAQSSDTIRVALVGCGGRGSGAADQALKTEGDVKSMFRRTIGLSGSTVTRKRSSWPTW
jgi:hypothetical protein